MKPSWNKRSNSPQNLLVTEALKIPELILPVLAPNDIRERS